MSRKLLLLAVPVLVAAFAVWVFQGALFGTGVDPERAERLRKPADADDKADKKQKEDEKPTKDKAKEKLAIATFGNGCFWCTEAVFQQLDGVQTAIPGYTGGKTKNPTYKEVCTGKTGHAEVIRITYDPKKISYVDLLEVFWMTHDPTTL